MPPTEQATAGKQALPARVERGESSAAPIFLAAKRGVDVLVAVLVLVAGSPLWLAIALTIRATSPGPAIYRQRRIGRQGRSFVMYKFRSMRDDAEQETGPVWATVDDPRYTRIGRLLRRVRLDEFPQLWNVLRGEMSLVGPRPERPAFVERFGSEIPGYTRRHQMRPGVTGLAQVSSGYDSSIDDVRRKLAVDLRYIEDWTLRLDFRVLLLTVGRMLRADGR